MSTPTCADGRRLLVKVCGLRYPDNIAEVAALHPDMMGFIFWSGSKRCALGLNPEVTRNLPAGITRVGVFVNATAEEILATADEYGLHLAQLHGDELPTMCRRLREKGLGVAKAIGVATGADLLSATAYEGCVDLMLFDTKSASYGGTGIAYDRSLLGRYTGSTPFLMSGGIGPGDAPAILSLSLPSLAGVDLNSRFETAPGIKNITALCHFMEAVRDDRP